MSGSGMVGFKIKSRLPPTLNQGYKIVNIKGVSRLALREDALDIKEELGLLAAAAKPGNFPVINGPGGGEYMLELVQHLSRNAQDTGFAPRPARWPRSFSLGRCRRGIKLECCRCMCVPGPSRVKALPWIELGRAQLPAVRT